MPDDIRIPADVLAEYRRSGWHITEHGRPDAAITTGPCGRCRQPTEVYGPNARPLCPNCEGGGNWAETLGYRVELRRVGGSDA